MRPGLVLVSYFVVAATFGAGMVPAADWYVAATAADGDGTKDKPFDGIFRAIDKASPGDVIHVVQGTYHGKLKLGFIVIDKRGLTLAGGYKDASFGERNPFLYPTIIAEAPQTKNSSFDGGYIRVTNAQGFFPHQGTTIDGFWFDRKGQNGYSTRVASIMSIAVPIVSNTKPVIVFEQPDCHVRNCVFLNTALYALRLTGDGSSAENNLFCNVNYAGLDLYGKGEKIGKGYPFNKILVKGNTFFSMWNAVSLEGGAGSAIVQGGNATIEVTDNIFNLSAGNEASKGWTVKDERNFKSDPWIIYKRNSVSQMLGGVARIYDTGTTSTLGIDKVSDLKDTCWIAADNDEEDPMYKVDAEWFGRYCSQIPDEDMSKKPVVMDQNNKLRRMLGLPLDGGTRQRGKYMGLWYPIEHVKTGAFWHPTNEKLKGRGVQTDGPFPIVQGTTVASESGSGTAGAPEAPPADRTYADVDFDTLKDKGETLYDQGVKFNAYYCGTDSTFGSGFGKQMKAYLAEATDKTHKIITLRKVPEATSADPYYKGFVSINSKAYEYLTKKCKRVGQRTGESDQTFVVRGVVRKPGAPLTTLKGSQLVIEIEQLSAE